MLEQLESQSRGPEAVFSKNFIQKENPIATFAVSCRKSISGNQTYTQAFKTDWLKVAIVQKPFAKRNVEVHIFDRAILSDFTIREFKTKKR